MLNDQQKALVLWIAGLSLSQLLTLQAMVDAAESHWGDVERKREALWDAIQARDYEVPTPPQS